MKKAQSDVKGRLCLFGFTSGLLQISGRGF